LIQVKDFQTAIMHHTDQAKALASLAAQGDALAWLLSGLHGLCRANRPKAAAVRDRRRALAERIKILVSLSYQELLQERSAHGAVREVNVETLCQRLRCVQP
jgi:hypothetical protein